MTPIVLALCGTLVASGLALYAAHRREWTLAFFMALIALLSLAAAWVAFDCLDQGLFDGDSRAETIWARGDRHA